MSANQAADRVRKLTERASANSVMDDHREAMEVYKLQDRISEKLELLDLVQSIRNRSSRMTVNVAYCLAEFYLAWYSTSEHLVKSIGRLKSYSVDRAPEFLKEHRAVAEQLSDYREARNRLAQVLGGDTTTLAEALNGVRRCGSAGSV